MGIHLETCGKPVSAMSNMLAITGLVREENLSFSAAAYKHTYRKTNRSVNKSYSGPSEVRSSSDCGIRAPD